jgi:hypothetical protein
MGHRQIGANVTYNVLMIVLSVHLKIFSRPDLAREALVVPDPGRPVGQLAAEKGMSVNFSTKSHIRKLHVPARSEDFVLFHLH